MTATLPVLSPPGPVLITGASGFIGGHLLQRLRQQNLSLRTLSRRALPNLPDCILGSLNQPEVLRQACQGIDTVFHCAGYGNAARILTDAEVHRHWSDNFEGSRNLVQAAGAQGVRTFVFLSAAKAMGEPGHLCADEYWPRPPSTIYGQSKLAAEKVILETGRKYGMHVVILRLPLVYGPGDRGNLEKMAQMIRRGLFPPLPETGNRRSLIHVEDVLDAMCLVANRREASGQIYLLSDSKTYSGRQIYNAIRSALTLPPKRFAVPMSLLKAAARTGDAMESLLGRRLPVNSDMLDKLLGSAWYSPAKISRELGWRAQIHLNQGLNNLL
ncbi:MAG: hypothetical protein RIR00_246 [Pseudomonadota bacterium]